MRGRVLRGVCCFHCGCHSVWRAVYRARCLRYRARRRLHCSRWASYRRRCGLDWEGCVLCRVLRGGDGWGRAVYWRWCAVDRGRRRNYGLQSAKYRSRCAQYRVRRAKYRSRRVKYQGLRAWEAVPRVLGAVPWLAGAVRLTVEAVLFPPGPVLCAGRRVQRPLEVVLRALGAVRHAPRPVNRACYPVLRVGVREGRVFPSILPASARVGQGMRVVLGASVLGAVRQLATVLRAE